MPTLRQLIFAMRDPVSGGRATRDIGFSDRLIADKIRESKNELLYEMTYDKYGRKVAEINPTYMQDLGILTLETVDIADSPDVTFGDLVKKVVLPKWVDLPDDAGLQFFGYMDKVRAIYLPNLNYGELDNYQQYPVAVQGRIMGTNQDGVVVYLYGKDIDELCYINVRMIADNPETATIHYADGTKDCFDWDKTVYPFPTWMEGQLKSRVIQKLFGETAQLPDDNKDDEIRNAVN